MMASGLDICVCNPSTDSFTTYEILIKTDNPAFTLHQSHTRRRYSDFCWLKKILKHHHPMSVCPELPEKKKFSGRFEIQFLVQRMKELQDWLYSVVSTSLYLSDTALHMFLQTSLSCKQIEQYLKGNLPEADVQSAYKDADLQCGDLDTKHLECSGDHGNKPGGSATKETLPIQIRARVALNDNSERSDSGIADSDIDSSFDSSGSPYVQSIESGVIPDNYPPVTEVIFPSSDRSDTMSNKIFRENVVQTTININPNAKLHHNGCMPGQSNCVNLKPDNVSDTVDTSNYDTEVENSAEQKTKPSVTHKVEMGVIFSLNS